MAVETVTFTVEGKHKVEMVGEHDAVVKILSAFVRGAAEMYVDEQHIVGRSREEVVAEMQKRIKIADAHYRLGESDGYHCDLSDA